MVAANVVDARGKPLFDSHRFLQLGERRVGIFGVLTLSASDAEAARTVGYGVTDPLEAAQGVDLGAAREGGRGGGGPVSPGRRAGRGPARWAGRSPDWM